MKASHLPTRAELLRMLLPLAARACVLRLDCFVRMAWPLLEPGRKLVWGPHMDAICAHLEAVADGRIKRIAVNVPPGHSKTSIITICWPVWVWLRYPEKKFLCASYAHTIARKANRARGVLVRSAWYALLRAEAAASFGAPRWELTIVNQSEIENDRRGLMRALSTEGEGTALHADYFVIDDPIRAKDIYTVRLQQHVTWFRETARSRVTDVQMSAFVVVAQRLAECFLPKSCITTPMGMTEIQKLDAGAEVLTSQGVERIIETASKPYQGEVIGVRTNGWPTTTWMTPEHPVLTTKGWKQAAQLSSLDRLLYPLPAGPETLDPALALWPAQKVVKPPKNGSHLTGTRKPRVTKEALQALVDQGLNSTQIAQHIGLKTRGMVDKYRAIYGIPRGNWRGADLPVAILERPEFWRMAGRWIADGSLSRGRDGEFERVALAIGAKKAHHIEPIERLMAEYGIGLSKTKEGNVFKVSFAARQIAQFLLNFGYGARNKFLPEWAIRLPKELFQQLIIGHWEGDGCMSDRGHVRISSSSIGLLQGLQRGLLRIGIVASVFRVSGLRPTFIDGRHGLAQAGYEIRFHSTDAPWVCGEHGARPNEPQIRNRIVDGRLEVRIRKLSRKEYEGPVYDIETPSHDFLAGLFTAHNCDLSGIVTQDPLWDWLRLPAEYNSDPAKQSRSSIGWKDWRTEDGEPLFPARFPREFLDHEKGPYGIGPVAFSAQHNQDPVGGLGGVFERRWWRFWTDDPQAPKEVRRLPDEADEVVGSWDMAFKAAARGSFVVGQVWARKGGDFYLLDQIRARLGFGETRRAFRSLKARWPECGRWLVEEKANGAAIIEELKREIPGIIPVVPLESKEARANAVSSFVEAGNVFLPDFGMVHEETGTMRYPWVQLVVDECASFPLSTYNDVVDTMTQALRDMSHRMRRRKGWSLPAVAQQVQRPVAPGQAQLDALRLQGATSERDEAVAKTARRLNRAARKHPPGPGLPSAKWDPDA